MALDSWWHLIVGRGGRLLALYDGAVQVVERAEGEATVHPSTLMHAVTMMESSSPSPLLSLAQQSQLPIESNGYADMGSGAATGAFAYNP